MLGHLKEEATAGGEDAAEEGLAATDQRETLELNLEYNETLELQNCSVCSTLKGASEAIYFSAGCGTPVTSVCLLDQRQRCGTATVSSTNIGTAALQRTVAAERHRMMAASAPAILQNRRFDVMCRQLLFLRVGDFKHKVTAFWLPQIPRFTYMALTNSTSLCDSLLANRESFATR